MGLLKERRHGPAGKRSSTQNMDHNMLSAKTRSETHLEKFTLAGLRPRAISDSVLDVSEQKEYSLDLTDGLPRHGPSDWDKVTKHERSVFNFVLFITNRNTLS